MFGLFLSFLFDTLDILEYFLKMLPIEKEQNINNVPKPPRGFKNLGL
jgi:hypothetical protein